MRADAGELSRRRQHRHARFTQPDPIGLAGGLNLYGYAGGDPINKADPLGLCPGCRAMEVAGNAVRDTFSPYSTGANLAKLSDETVTALMIAAIKTGARAGVSQGIEGTHSDPRHNGCSTSNGSTRCDWPELAGQAADINELWTASGRVDIGQDFKVRSVESMLLANEFASALLSQDGVRAVIWPTGNVKSWNHRGARVPQPFAPGGFLWQSHQNHIHASTYTGAEGRR